MQTFPGNIMTNLIFRSVILLSIFFLIFSSNLDAQKSELYTPINIQWAYENDTRSLDGKPGPEYWINKSNYNISVELIPEKKLVVGSEAIEYFNNSPDSLTMIVIRLYQDILKKGNVRDWQINPDALTDGVFLTKLIVGNKEINLAQQDEKFSKYGTNIYLTLDDKLPPSGSIKLEIDWRFEISSLFPVRMGSYNDTTYMIAYWYPQIAVYDDISEWDTFHYEGTTEFYNDFNDYNVAITVPREYLVWATGELQNPENVLREKYLKRYKQALSSDEIVKIVTADDADKGSITADKEKNRWIFKAEHVPDFAIAAAKGYLWDASGLIVDKKTSRRVFISAAYNRESKDFYEVAELSRTIIDKLSNEFPGIPYPYPEMTVFNGSGGMEYPMMVNDGSVEDRERVVQLTSHEISHSYFPFYAGTNERKYAWMDEGWAVMLPMDIQTELEPTYEPRIIFSQSYANYAGLELEVPPMVSSTLLTSTTYRTAAYNRPAMAYEFLRGYLGDDLFKDAIKEYVNRWNGKHPIPYDFFYTFNDVANEDLNWYWKPWFFEFGYPDLAIDDVIQGDEELKILIEKTGNIPLPVKVKVIYEDGTQDSVFMNAGIWKNGNDKTMATFKSGKKVKSVELGDLSIPDVNYKDNKYTSEED